MKETEIFKLKNRRQYLVAPHRIECPPYFVEKQLAKTCILYFHTDLNVTEYRNNQVSLTLLGEIFDFESPKKQNQDILKDLSKGDLELFSEKLSDYTGRYVIIRITDHKTYFFHDAIASRKVYYTSDGDGNWGCSRPELLADILNIRQTQNEAKLKYYNSKECSCLNGASIGNMTIYDEIFQLLPNHYLDFNQLTVTRYWPVKPIEQISLHEAANKCAKMIKGYVTAINERFDLMVPLTSGKDSRIILAATKDIREQVYYYINKGKKMSDKNPDVVVPTKMAKELGFDFHVLEPEPNSITKNFKKVFYENNSRAGARYFPFIYNYFKNFSDKVNVPGVFAASAIEMYGLFDKNINSRMLAKLNWVDKYDYAVEYYTRWFNSRSTICKKNNLSILMLFYWEERLANWGTQTQLEKDIAQEDLTPYNSRKLVEYTFSVPRQFINIPDYKLYKEIMKILWPETLNFPINPGIVQYIKLFLSRLKLLNIIFAVRFMFKNRKYRSKHLKRILLKEKVSKKLVPEPLKMAKVS